MKIIQKANWFTLGSNDVIDKRGIVRLLTV